MSTRPRFRNPFRSEQEVAALVRQRLEVLGWIVHPECCGWDLLAVSETVPGVFRGDLLGVECKLDAGTASGYASVLRQALPAWVDPRRPYGQPPRGPHYRAVASPRFADVTPFHVFGIAAWKLARCRHDLRTGSWTWEIEPEHSLPLGTRFLPDQPPLPPEIVIDVPAGVPSPQTSSRWKIAAVRMMLRLRDGGATCHDFRAADLAFSTFRQRGWIQDSGRKVGRAVVWIADDGRPGDPPPDQKWPQIVAALEAIQ